MSEPPVQCPTKYELLVVSVAAEFHISDRVKAIWVLGWIVFPYAAGHRRNEGRVFLYAFDLLHLDGRDPAERLSVSLGFHQR